MVLRSPVRLASYGPTLRLSSCSHRGEVGGHTASWVGSEVTAAEYAGMHGHCHASGGGGGGDREPRRGEQASRWTRDDHGLRGTTTVPEAGARSS